MKLFNSNVNYNPVFLAMSCVLPVLSLILHQTQKRTREMQLHVVLSSVFWWKTSDRNAEKHATTGLHFAQFCHNGRVKDPHAQIFFAVQTTWQGITSACWLLFNCLEPLSLTSANFPNQRTDCWTVSAFHISPVVFELNTKRSPGNFLWGQNCLTATQFFGIIACWLKPRPVVCNWDLPELCQDATGANSLYWLKRHKNKRLRLMESCKAWHGAFHLRSWSFSVMSNVTRSQILSAGKVSVSILNSWKDL